jgi:hypothetical protein
MKGGVLIDYEYNQNDQNDQNDAFNYFMDNAECIILDDNSATGIIYICEFKPSDKTLKTPYKSTRSNNLLTPINKILLKIMFNTKEKIKPRFAEIMGIHRSTLPNVEVINVDAIDNEINNQNELYKKSYLNELSYFEPICPCIITYDHNIIGDKKKKLCDQILKNFKERMTEDGKKIKYEITSSSDREITTNFFADNFKVKVHNYDKEYIYNTRDITIIVMELLDGYDTLYNSINKISKSALSDIEKENKYKCIYGATLLELIRLSNNFGINHDDAHQNNIMINANFCKNNITKCLPYFPNIESSSNPLSDEISNYRAIIIDFGKVTKKQKIENKTILNVDDIVTSLKKHSYKNRETVLSLDLLLKMCKINLSDSEVLDIIMYLYRSRQYANELIEQNFLKSYKMRIKGLTMDKILYKIKSTDRSIKSCTYEGKSEEFIDNSDNVYNCKYNNNDIYNGTFNIIGGIKVSINNPLLEFNKGEYIFANGDKYIGEFINENKTTKGVFLFENQQKIEGPFPEVPITKLYDFIIAHRLSFMKRIFVRASHRSSRKKIVLLRGGLRYNSFNSKKMSLRKINLIKNGNQNSNKFALSTNKPSNKTYNSKYNNKTSKQNLSNIKSSSVNINNDASKYNIFENIPISILENLVINELSDPIPLS